MHNSNKSFGFGLIVFRGQRKRYFGISKKIWRNYTSTLQYGKGDMTKIKYVKGDLLEAPEQFLLHGCNAQGVMGSGVAKLIREKWPKAYADYRSTYHSFGLTLGSIVSSYQSDSRCILNAITQETYGREGVHVSYWAIANVMRQLDQNRIVKSVGSVAMPMIGAGLAGGDWNVIEAIIENTANNFQPVIYHL